MKDVLGGGMVLFQDYTSSFENIDSSTNLTSFICYLVTGDDGLEDGKPVDCPYCERTYKRLTSLKEHIKYRHEKTVNNFACPECNYCFAYKSQLERHMATHMPGRNQICDICNKAFVNIYRLQRHMLTHTSGNRKFKCSECGKAFKYKHHLKEHLRIHSGEKPYECSVCKKRFSHSGSYSSHISSKKCSPVKENPQAFPRVPPAPVKVINGSLSPSAVVANTEDESRTAFADHTNNGAAYMTPLHIKIPAPDGTVESGKESEKSAKSQLTTPPNEAVKRVLEMVDATATKQQQEGQNTDISKLKKTVSNSKMTPQKSPKIVSPVTAKNGAKSPTTEQNAENKVVLPSDIAKELSSSKLSMLYPNGSTPDKNYSIVDYTLRKVHEAQAIARCLESQHPGQLLSDKAGCKYCGKAFESPIELHQHERYLCDFNEDVQKIKGQNSNLSKFYEYQKEVLASMKNGHDPRSVEVPPQVAKLFAKEMEAERERELAARQARAKSVSPRASSPRLQDERPISPRSLGASPIKRSLLLTTLERREEMERENGEKEDEEDIVDEEQTEKEIEESDSAEVDISNAQHQALRAFYAMQAHPSSDGIQKISLALHLSQETVEMWFEKTRKLEEAGEDPSLKSLQLMKETYLKREPRSPHRSPSKQKQQQQQQHLASNPPSPSEAPSPTRRSDSNIPSPTPPTQTETDSRNRQSPSPSPRSPVQQRPTVLQSTEKALSEYSLERRTPPALIMASPNTQEATEALQQLRHAPRENGHSVLSASNHTSPTSSPQPPAVNQSEDSPLDLSMPKKKTASPSPPPAPTSAASKLMYGYPNFPSLYNMAGNYVFPGFPPAAPPPPSNLCLENTVKAHAKNKSTPPNNGSHGNNNFLLKRPYTPDPTPPPPVLAYLPYANGFSPKRMKYATEGMEYLNGNPYPVTLPITDAYMALAKSGYNPLQMRDLAGYPAPGAAASLLKEGLHNGK